MSVSCDFVTNILYGLMLKPIHTLLSQIIIFVYSDFATTVATFFTLHLLVMAVPVGSFITITVS